MQSQGLTQELIQGLASTLATMPSALQGIMIGVVRVFVLVVRERRSPNGMISS